MKAEFLCIHRCVGDGALREVHVQWLMLRNTPISFVVCDKAATVVAATYPYPVSS